MKSGDLVEVKIWDNSNPNKFIQKFVSGIIIQIERSQVNDDGPVSPIVTVLTSSGKIESLGRGIKVISQIDVVSETVR